MAVAVAVAVAVAGLTKGFFNHIQKYFLINVSMYFKIKRYFMFPLHNLHAVTPNHFLTSIDVTIFGRQLFFWKTRFGRLCVFHFRLRNFVWGKYLGELMGQGVHLGLKF